MLKIEKNYNLYEKSKDREYTVSFNAILPIVESSDLLVQIDEYDELRDVVIDIVKDPSKIYDITILDIGPQGAAGGGISTQLNNPVVVYGGIVILYTISRVTGSIIDEFGKDLYGVLKKIVIKAYQEAKKRREGISIVIYDKQSKEAWYLITPYSSLRDVKKLLENIPEHYVKVKSKKDTLKFELNPESKKIERRSH